jgi:hypothetical protein
LRRLRPLIGQFTSGFWVVTTGVSARLRAAAQVLDVDMTGQPCGPKAAFATKGYFAGKRNRRGRQVGRVLASQYAEIVGEQIQKPGQNS